MTLFTSNSSGHIEKTTSLISTKRFAVIDIGSNSVRLVVYQSPRQISLPLLNERVLCGLGRDIARTGKLNPSGAKTALLHLMRFQALAKAMNVCHMDVVATSAVRDAKNGISFINKITQQTGIEVRVLSGDEEAQLSAAGVLFGTTIAEGAMGDLGGGSLELVNIENGRASSYISLPLGPLRIAVHDFKKNVRSTSNYVDSMLHSVAWLPQMNNQNFYAVGGAWRMLARLFMKLENYPLHIIHGYEIEGSAVTNLLRRVSRMACGTDKLTHGFSRHRLDALPWASLVMERLFKLFTPSKLVFSACGLREGCLYSHLDPNERTSDPLYTSCSALAGQSRFKIEINELLTFINVAIINTCAVTKRLAHAAAILSDYAWSEHPDYRAQQAYHRILFAPMTGIDHRERAFLAIALARRYGASPDDLPDKIAFSLLTPTEIDHATIIGLALRLAFLLSGGAPGMLSNAKLAIESNNLVLYLPKNGSMIASDSAVRRLKFLAKSLGKRPLIRQNDIPQKTWQHS